MKIDFSPFPILKCKRLTLNKLDIKHSDAIYNYQSDKNNFPYVDMPVYVSVDEAIEYINKMNNGVKQNKWIIWAICLKDTNEIIGTISVWNLNDELNKAELGYGIFPEYRRQGYMAEALNAVVKYALNEMELSKLEAYTSSFNKPSITFLKRMNFSYVETVEDEYSDGALMDIFEMNNL